MGTGLILGMLGAVLLLIVVLKMIDKYVERRG